MAWLRDSDDYTQRAEWDGVSYEARWHYRAMVEHCSRSKRWDGRLPLEQARRVSDVPDPDGCIAELEAIGYALVTGNEPVDNSSQNGTVTRNVTSHVTSQTASHVTPATVTLTRIDEHIPPPGMRDNAAKSKIRMRRKRAHDQGEHSLCLPKHCPDAPRPTPPDGPGDVARNADFVTRNPGTGLDRTSAPRKPEPPADDRRPIESGLVGGVGGGPARDVARNAPRHTEPAGELGDAVQDRKGIRWLAEHWRLGDDVAAHVIHHVRADARARGNPIRSLTGYLAAMHANGDLTDIVGAALDRVEGRAVPWGSEDTEPPGDDAAPDLRVITGQPPRSRRAAIDSCRYCDSNGMTNTDPDRPKRCDHQSPDKGSQMPMLAAMDGGAGRDEDDQGGSVVEFDRQRGHGS